VRYEEIDRRHKAGKVLSEEDGLFHADYEAKRAATNERKRVRDQANKNKYEEIDRRHKAGKVLSEEDELFHADYEDKLQRNRDANNERYHANKNKYEEIDRRHKAGKVLSEEDKLFQAKHEDKFGSKERTSRDLFWIETLGMLRPLIEEDGFINYRTITNTAIERRIRNFVRETRVQNKKRLSGERSSLKDWRRQKLAEINFSFSPVSRAEAPKQQKERASCRALTAATKPVQQPPPVHQRYQHPPTALTAGFYQQPLAHAGYYHQPQPAHAGYYLPHPPPVYYQPTPPAPRAPGYYQPPPPPGYYGNPYERHVAREAAHR